MDSWSTHRWIPSDGRVVKIKGRLFKHFLCEDCKRDFVDELWSGERYAAIVLVFGFERLADEVTRRWLASSCPPKPPAGDEEDRCYLRCKVVRKTAPPTPGQAGPILRDVDSQARKNVDAAIEAE